MNWLQRIAEVIVPHKQPPPNGSMELKRAMEELAPSTRALEERIRQPVPSVADIVAGRPVRRNEQ